jgi:hypothetical protein
MRKLAFALVLAISAGTLQFTPAFAEIGTEDPLDPCFDSSSGVFARSYVTNETTTERNDVWGSPRSAEISRSGSLFRGNYNYYSSTSQTNSITRETQVFYDSASDTKTVTQQAYVSYYFMTYLYVSFAGFLVGENGEDSVFTTWLQRSVGGDGGSGELSLGLPRTQVIERHCGSSGGSNSPLLGEVFEFQLSPEFEGTLSIPASSSNGSQAAQLSIEKGSVDLGSRLFVTNDPNSAENQFGLASLAFKLIDEFGNPSKLMKPITLDFHDGGIGKLAKSQNGETWTWLDNAPKKAGGFEVVELTSSSFSISGTSSPNWLFVGQKLAQKKPILYASRFSGPVGLKVSLTTTSGSGKGGVEMKSETPGFCEILSDRKVVFLKRGVCEISATKAGFDGYVHAQTQVIRLEIGD